MKHKLLIELRESSFNKPLDERQTENLEEVNELVSELLDDYADLVEAGRVTISISLNK